MRLPGGQVTFAEMYAIVSLIACQRTDLFDVAAEVDPDHPNVVHVTWATRKEVSGWVEFGLTEDFGQSSPPDAETREHDQLMLGLKSGHTYFWRVANQVGDEVVYSETATVDVPDVLEGLPAMTLTVNEPDADMHGRYLMVIGASADNVLYNPGSSFFIAIIDGDGEYVWYHMIDGGFGTNGAYPFSDGQSIYWLQNPIIRQEQDGEIHRMSLDGTEYPSSLAVTAHHAATEIPGEQFAHLGRQFFPFEPTGAQSTDRVMIVDAGDPEGESSTELFSYFDDWWGGSFEYYWLDPCSESFQSAFGYEPLCEMSHSNSLAYVESQDALYAYARHMDTMLKIDRTTGELQWIMGGPKSEFTFPDGTPVQPTPAQPRLWSGGHYSQVFEDGLVMFDNGLSYEPQISSILEIKWDEDARTVEEVFRFPDPAGGFTDPLGDAKRLASGHYVGAWMTLSKINEVDPARFDPQEPGEAIVWEMRSSAVYRRIHMFTDLYDLTKTYY